MESNFEHFNSKPLISVVLPVYNGASDVMVAVDSILKQTLTNFELIIINDGSRDNSREILDSISDPRIRLYHQENKGLAATLNIGVELANSNFIARQDQDDLSMPERLQKQFDYMLNHPNCALLGTRAEIWVGDEKSERYHDHPTGMAELTFDLMFNNPFVHSSVMLRKDLLLAIGGYCTDPARQPPEDYELWSRIARHYEVANLEDRLLAYREVPNSMSRVGPNPFLDKLIMISAENIAQRAGLTSVTSDCIDVASLTHSAKEKVSKKANIERMCGLLLRATENIAKEFNEPSIINRGEERVRILKYQYFLDKINTTLIRSFVSRLRSFAKKIISRI